MKVLLYRDLSVTQLERLRSRHPSLEVAHPKDLASLERELADAEVAFGYIPAALLARAPKLRWIQIISSGFDEYASLGGTVTVTTAHGLHAVAIAEHVMMGLLLFARNFATYFRQQQRHVWDRKVHTPFLLQGQTAGLIGYGEIGRALAPRLRAFGLRINAVKLTAAPTPAGLDNLWDFSRLDELLATSDHVILNLPLTPTTRGLLNADRILRIKSGACFYNGSRGGLVDEDALLRRLRDRSLRGALIDVFDREPLAPDSPFWDLDNVFVTPHMAGHYGGLPAATYEFFLANLERYVQGLPLKNVADFARGY